eukprot:scaffold13729_cov105-Isochrysis_galbana.AAC.2
MACWSDGLAQSRSGSRGGIACPRPSEGGGMPARSRRRAGASISSGRGALGAPRGAGGTRCLEGADGRPTDAVLALMSANDVMGAVLDKRPTLTLAAGACGIRGVLDKVRLTRCADDGCEGRCDEPGCAECLAERPARALSVLARSACASLAARVEDTRVAPPTPSNDPSGLPGRCADAARDLAGPLSMAALDRVKLPVLARASILDKSAFRVGVLVRRADFLRPPAVTGWRVGALVPRLGSATGERCGRWWAALSQVSREDRTCQLLSPTGSPAPILETLAVAVEGVLSTRLPAVEEGTGTGAGMAAPKPPATNRVALAESRGPQQCESLDGERLDTEGEGGSASSDAG